MVGGVIDEIDVITHPRALKLDTVRNPALPTAANRKITDNLALKAGSRDNQPSDCLQGHIHAGMSGKYRR